MIQKVFGLFICALFLVSCQNTLEEPEKTEILETKNRVESGIDLEKTNTKEDVAITVDKLPEDVSTETVINFVEGQLLATLAEKSTREDLDELLRQYWRVTIQAPLDLFENKEVFLLSVPVGQESLWAEKLASKEIFESVVLNYL